MRNRMIYGVYADDELEECVYVGTAEEIAREYKVHRDAIYDYVSQGRLLKNKYRIKKVGYEDEIERS